MSVFDELISKLNEISNAFIKNFNDDVKEALRSLDKFEEKLLNGKQNQEKTLKEKPVLTCIEEVDGEAVKTPEEKPKIKQSLQATNSTERKENENVKPKQVSKKRSKNEVDDMFSPEVNKRQKRTASVVAQNNISKQVNVNLTQKLRRDGSPEKNQTKSRRQKDEDKENTEPIPNIQIKEEKISLPPEPLEQESLPIMTEIKQEVQKDEIAMPPPAVPLPKPKRGVHKVPSEDSTEEDSGKRRTTRTRKQTETVPAAPVPSARMTRASTRASTRAPQPAETQDVSIKETRPKRTRGRKKKSDVTIETDKDSQSTQDSGIGSPADKPRPKRTRKAQKAVETEIQKEAEIPPPEIPDVETESSQSPILICKSKPVQSSINISNKTNDTCDSKAINEKKEEKPHEKVLDEPKADIKVDEIILNTDNPPVEEDDGLDKTQVIHATNLNTTVTINSGLDKTVVLPNGVYNQAPVTPKNVHNMNETVVIEKSNRDTIVLDKPKTAPMDATMVLDRLGQTNITDDNSLLTDDNDTPVKTPPKTIPKKTQPSSAVKEKVQQFEELASRVTRTKTKANLTKKNGSMENQTPPDKISKVVLSSSTLTKMNGMIFNAKPPQTSNSAVKLTSQIPTTIKPYPSSTSKISSINKAREAAEEFQKKEKEDARKKKEAMLEAKREMQKKKREEKMAAAATAREMAEKERRAAMEAAVRERMEKQANADLGKLERLKEAERKKQEFARKVAETEERRKAEEQARAQRLADEQKRTEAARKKQQEEAEAVKKEMAIMAREIEKKQREYIEKQKMKSKMDIGRSTPLKTCSQQSPQEPVYMMDGFQYLNSDSEDEEPKWPVPSWSKSKQQRALLCVQSGLPEADVDALFGVRPHCPDLRAIFPDIERARLKRTSSAVWRTPPIDTRYKT
ncbi:inner centromere protein [Battus philenor]|uniref:inner centromere protein n=1 Tax=Battus philenor TaxID=42288 RepID=UPI0035CF3B30